MTSCLVLWWSYSDGSASDVKRVYVDEDEKAKADLALLNERSTATYFLTPVELFQDGILSEASAE